MAQVAKSNAQGDFQTAAGSGRKNRRTPPLLVERATASTLGGRKDLAIVEQHIQAKLKSYAAEILPGVDTALAGAIIAELGMDMSVFENASEPAFWTRVCPGSNNRRVFVDWHAPCLPSLAEFAPEKELSLATVVPDANSRIMTA